jgi:hypothetical protein
MKVKTEDFVGSAFKAIACTPNQNFDTESYQAGVVEPARRLRRLMETQGGEEIAESRIAETLAALDGILRCKRCDDGERLERLRDTLADNGLLERFGRLLPEEAPLDRPDPALLIRTEAGRIHEAFAA